VSTWQIVRDGIPIFRTDYDECFYPLEIQEKMISLGWKILKDGKNYKPEKNKKQKG
jgi:hypothetical protein